MIFLIAGATFVATLLGGLFALRFRDRLHLILGFSAGAVVGVALFDLLPESIEISSKFFSVQIVTSVVALGLVFYMIVDRFVVMHSHNDDEVAHTHNHRKGILGAGSFSLHSFLDGIGIGLGFQVSPILGIILAVAVLTHDFSDGINTVSVILKNGGERKNAFKWLLVDAFAPVLGIVSTMFFTIPEKFLGLVLALFCGFFLYIGASDLVPESHHNHPTKWTTISTILGMAVLYFVIRLVSF